MQSTYRGSRPPHMRNFDNGPPVNNFPTITLRPKVVKRPVAFAGVTYDLDVLIMHRGNCPEADVSQHDVVITASTPRYTPEDFPNSKSGPSCLLVQHDGKYHILAAPAFLEVGHKVNKGRFYSKHVLKKAAPV